MRGGFAILAAVGLACFPAAAAGAPRQIAPDEFAPPEVGAGKLERAPARGPLSPLGQASKPRPKGPKGRDGGRLFNPLAPAAGIIEAGGLTVTLSGVRLLGVEEKCSTPGADWACGLRARTAFRAFLGRRAVVCELPPDIVSGATTARCSLGNRDIAEWLVANGWAWPEPGGAYEEAGAKAVAASRGMFGAPPDLSALPAVPTPLPAAGDELKILALPSSPSQEIEPSAPAPDEPAGLY